MKFSDSPAAIPVFAIVAVICIALGPILGSGCGGSTDPEIRIDPVVSDCTDGFTNINLYECDVERHVQVKFETNIECTIRVSVGQIGNIWISHSGDLMSVGSLDHDDFIGFGHRIGDDGVGWTRFAHPIAGTTVNNDLVIQHFVNFEMYPDTTDVDPTVDFRFRNECVESGSFGI